MDSAGAERAGAPPAGVVMAAPTRRHRMLKWALLLVSGSVGTCLVGLVARSISIRRAEARERPRQEERLRRWEAEAVARTGNRPVLSPTAEPGNAWEEYDPAFLECAGIAKPDLEAVTAVIEHKGGEPDLKRALEALAKFGPSLGRIRAGTRKSGLKPPWPLVRPLPEPLPQLMGARNAARLLRLASQDAAERGDRTEAADICLAQMQVGSDLLRGPTLIFALIGQVHVATAAVQLAELVDTLDAAETARVLRSLLTLDAQMPAFSDCLPSEILSGHAALREQQAGIGYRERAFLLWKSTSSALVQYECGARYEEILERIRAGEPGSWIDAQSGYEVPASGERGLGAIIIDLLRPALRMSESVHRASRARIRLLEAFLMVRSGSTPGCAGWPVDPFDLKPVRWHDREGSIELSSVWKDCVPSPVGDWLDPDKIEGDCILRVPARPEPK